MKMIYGIPIILGIVFIGCFNPNPNDGISKLSTTKTIESFTFFNITSEEDTTIDGDKVTIEVPFGTNIENLVPVIRHNGASIIPEAYTMQAFSDSEDDPFEYTVTAENTTTQVYKIYIKRKGIGIE